MDAEKWLESMELIGQTLSELMTPAGVTGQEEAVADKIEELLGDLPVVKKQDAMGNLAAVFNPQGRPRVMFVAHMDEIGWVVKKIDPQGFLHLYPLGGVPENILRGQWVRVITRRGPVSGAVVVKPPHLAASGEALMVVDIGVDSAEEAQALGVAVGDQVVVERHFALLNNSQRAIGRCFDNRMGCALLIHLLRYLAASQAGCCVIAVFSSTEEHGMGSHSRNFAVFGSGSRGAWLPAQVGKPDLAFVVDTNTCSDLPGVPEHEVMVRMGKGPVLRFLDDLTILRREVRDFMLRVAEEEGIPVQIGFSMAYTDASVIQMAGIPVGVIGIPLRYLHSPAQVLHLPDLLLALRWAAALVKKAPEYVTRGY